GRFHNRGRRCWSHNFREIAELHSTSGRSFLTTPQLVHGLFEPSREECCRRSTDLTSVGETDPYDHYYRTSCTSV
ncbi:hypothetical protein L9F63_009793, partial [Diploptera punctata]